MNNRTMVFSYALAAMASLCFVGGIAILSGGRVENHGQTGANYIHTRRNVGY